VKAELFAAYSSHEAALSELRSYLGRLLDSEKVVRDKLAPNYQRELDELVRAMEASAREILNRRNELFQADPEAEYLGFMENQKGRIRTFVSSLDRRLTIDRINLSGADPENKALPLVVHRMSQDAVNASINYVRDIESGGHYYVREGVVVLAPQIPGVILRGRLNADLNFLLGKMNSGFLGKNFDSKVEESRDGLPFEIVLESRFGNAGWLGLDARSIRLFDGERTLRFDRNSQNHQFFLDLVKVYLAQSLSALNVQAMEPTGDPRERRHRWFHELRGYFRTVEERYGDLGGESSLQDIVKAMSVDLQFNPHKTAGSDYVSNKGKVLFSNVIRYDPADRLFKMQLDPGIVLDQYRGSEQLAPGVECDADCFKGPQQHLPGARHRRRTEGKGLCGVA
jgi:hypothetical protein